MGAAMESYSYYCHADCSYTSVLNALVGAPATPKVYTKESKPNYRPDNEAIATYSYFDEQNVLLYQTLRFEKPKDFRPRVPIGNGRFRRGLPKTVRRVLYRLPELLTTDTAKTVFVVEGEKDVEALRDRGLIATCNVGGAGKWRDEYSESLRKRHVCILPDNDRPGRKHAHQVATALYGIAASVRVVELIFGE